MKPKSTKLMMVLFLAMMIYASQDLSAQVIELNAFTGWQLNGRAKLYDGEFRLSDAQNYGGKLAYGLSSSTFVELSYMRSDLEGQFFPYGIGNPGDRVKLSSNYIQIGGLQSLNLGRVDPYGTVALGLTVWYPKESSYSSKTQFSATVGAGIKIWLSEMIGLRLQGSLLMPMVFNGVGIGCGIGTGGAGCGSSLYTRITPFQGEFSGGLVIRISAN